MKIDSIEYDVMVNMYIDTNCEMCSDKWSKYLSPLEQKEHMYRMLEEQREYPEIWLKDLT